MVWDKSLDARENDDLMHRAVASLKFTIAISHSIRQAIKLQYL